MNARESLIYDFEGDILRRHSTRLNASWPRLIDKIVEVGTNEKALRVEDVWTGARSEVARLSELKQRCAASLLSFGQSAPHR